MKNEMLSLALIVGLMMPQGLLWAADSATPSPLPTASNNLPQDKQNINNNVSDMNVVQLKEENSQIKSLEGQMKELRTQYETAVKAGDKNKADTLKDQINTARKQLRETFEARHRTRINIHQDLVQEHQNLHELHHANARG